MANFITDQIASLRKSMPQPVDEIAFQASVNQLLARNKDVPHGDYILHQAFNYNGSNLWFVDGPVFVAPVSQAASPTLIWSDDFTSLDLASASNPNGAWRPNSIWQDLAKGYYDFAGSSWNINPNDAAPFPSHNPFSTSNSVLTIQAFHTPSDLTTPIQTEMTAQGVPNAVPAWCGGFLVTNSAVRKFKYGYFEYRAQWPNPGKGIFPALWLFASEGSNDVLNKGNAEIDVFEMFGASNLWTTSLHMRDNSGVGTDVTIGSRSEDTAGWHTYGIDWQPTYLRFYRDNVLVYEVTGSNAAYYNTTMNIIINFSMDASWFSSGLKSDGTTPSPMNMNIDYVRVYTSKP